MSASLDFSEGAGVSADYGDVTTYDGLANISISVWINRDTASSSDAVISKWDTANTTWAFLFEMDASGNVDFLIGDGVGSNIDWINSTSTWGTGSWHFLTCTWEGGGSNTMNIFVDGADDTGSRSDVGTGAGPTIPATTANFAVGARANGSSGNAFDGKIANVLVHNRSLSLAEHQELMYNPTGIPNGLLTWCPMNDETGRDYIQNVTPALNANVANSLLGPPTHRFQGAI